LPPAQRAVWLDVSRVLRSPELQDAFKRQVPPALEARFSRSIDRLTFYPVPMLLRDLDANRIGIHGRLGEPRPSRRSFYLPRDDSQAHLGTRLHEGRDARRRGVSRPCVPAGHRVRLSVRTTRPAQRPPTADADGDATP